MTELLDSFSQSNVVSFDEKAAVQLDLIRKAATVRTKPMDQRITAVALANDLILVTRNVRDFELIEGLRIEDWTK